MAFVREKIFCSIFGTVVEVKQISTKAKLLRKMYMGVWRRGAEIINVMRAKLAEMLIVYMNRKRRKRGICSSGWVEMPKRTKWEILVQFLLSISYLKNKKNYFHRLVTMSRMLSYP
jgi:hypothetical protein